MRAAYVGSAINVAVVAVALLVPALQRSAATFEKLIDRRQQDVRIVTAAGSLLVDVHRLLQPESILDEQVCTSSEPLNRFDQARLSTVISRGDALRLQVAAQGTTTTVQFMEEAAMARLTYALDFMRSAAIERPTAKFNVDIRTAFCIEARNDLIEAAKTGKRDTLTAISLSYLPVNGGWLDFDPLAGQIEEQGNDMRQDISSLKVLTAADLLKED